MASANAADKVRIGVIGVGIGQAHLKGYAQVPQAQVVALCDINEARAREVARDCSVPEADILTDYRALLDRSDIDAVSVCLPNVLHRPIAVDALQAGKHVICEKPLSINAAEAQLIADAAAYNNRKCMVAQVKRFSAEAQFLKQIIGEGELGDIYYAHAVCLRKRGIPGYGGWFTTKALSGGGPLIDIGVHLLDAAWWLAGCPRPVAAMGATYAEFGPQGKGQASWSAAQGQLTGTFDVEDLAVGLIRFDNGLTINLEASWALHRRHETQGISLYGQRAGCEWTNEVDIFRDQAGVPVSTRVELPQSDGWAGEMAHFVNCILNDQTPDPDAEQGVTMMKMLDAIYRSAQTKIEVSID